MGTISQIISMYTSGKIKKEEVCEILKISERTFERYLKKEGYSRRTHIRTKEGIYYEKNRINFWRKLYNFYNKGKSLQEVGLKYGINRHTILSMFEYHHFEIKSKKQLDEQKLKKRIETSIQKYGTSHPSKSIIVKDNLRNSVRKKYGVDNIMKLKDTQDKQRATTLKNYGVERPLQNTDIKKKQENTLMKRYGVDNPKKIKKDT